MEISKIHNIFEEVSVTVEQKNHDYDHAFHKAYQEIGPMYAVGKIFEKYSRIKKLSTAEAKVKNEGLEDALKDCMGYCALYLNEITE